jgi:integrase/recombinase XerC
MPDQSSPQCHSVIRKERTPTDLDTLIHGYRLCARTEGKSHNTISLNVTALRLFQEFLRAVQIPTDIDCIGVPEIRQFILYLQQVKAWRRHPTISPRSHGLSGHSINSYLRAISAFWSWLEREGLIRKNALKAVPAPRLPRRLPRAFSEDEVRKILHSAENRPRDRAMVQLFLDSGVRLSELVGLTVPDLDLRLGRLRVYGKGGKERYAYFSNRTAEALKRYISTVRPHALEEDRLFLNIDGTPMDKKRVSKVLEVVGRHAGISQRLSAHKLRHTFATLSLRFGNNLEYLRLALGHADIETTSKSYLAASDADVAIAQRRSSPMANIYK